MALFVRGPHQTVYDDSSITSQTSTEFIQDLAKHRLDVLTTISQHVKDELLPGHNALLEAVTAIQGQLQQPPTVAQIADMIDDLKARIESMRPTIQTMADTADKLGAEEKQKEHRRGVGAALKRMAKKEFQRFLRVLTDNNAHLMSA